ncbi:MAG TPA: hypothetical protein VHZ09_18080 [Acidobacteriaceae bacterium]|nr:hypothetical protein [Acidobacteriaceae bacterium]
MTRECCFILPNGLKCRCAATRNKALCRHHAPKPATAGPPPIPKCERYSDLIRWRRLGSKLQWMPLSEIPYTIRELLECLVDRGDDSTGRISDLTAGRFLRALLTRLGRVPFPEPGPEPDPASDSVPRISVPMTAPAIDPEDYAALMAAFAHIPPPLPRVPLPRVPLPRVSGPRAPQPRAPQPCAPSSRPSFHQGPGRVNQ